MSDEHEHDFAAWPFTNPLNQRRLWSAVCDGEDLGCFDSPEEAADAINAHITAPVAPPAPPTTGAGSASVGAGGATEQKTTRSERNSDRAEGAPAAPGTDGSA